MFLFRENLLTTLMTNVMTNSVVTFVRVKYRSIFKHPTQIRLKYYNIVRICGMAGFFTKGFIYATIGALTIESVFTEKVNNESPQGVFILLGSLPSGTGHVILILLLAGVIIYATWRFWEGITGQGYDPSFSKKKNFFRYRLSPLASGLVYLLYGAYIVYLFTLKPPKVGSSVTTSAGSCFPICWRGNIIKEIALGILAFSFTVATITQLIPALTGNFRNELDFDKFRTTIGRGFKFPFLICGHIGFFSRAVLFFLVCFLFWKVLLGDPGSLFLDPHQSTVGQAINSIRNSVWGVIVMTALGIGLIIYGLFAVMCMFFKIFPTPPPSMNLSLPSTQNDVNDSSQIIEGT